MTYDVAIAFARLYAPDVAAGPVRGGGTLYRDLRFLPDVADVPILLNHDSDREVGRIHSLMPMDWTSGRWLVGLGEVDEAALAYVRRDAPASFSWISGSSYDLDGWTVVSRGIVREVTVVGPGFDPVDCGARVLSVRAAQPPAARTAPAGTTHRDLPAEMLAWAAAAPTGVVRRPGIGRVLGVR